MPDFSHFRKIDLLHYEAYLLMGRKMSDAMFADALGAMSEPLLDVPQMTLLLRELDEGTARKTGRPAGALACRKTLAKNISAIGNNKLPPVFRSAIIERLTGGRRYSELERATPVERVMARHRVRSIYEGLYDMAYAQLRSGLAVTLPVVGRNEEPLEGAPARQAWIATVAAARRLGLYPPSIERLHNLISEKPRQSSRRKKLPTKS